MGSGSEGQQGSENGHYVRIFVFTHLFARSKAEIDGPLFTFAGRQVTQHKPFRFLLSAHRISLERVVTPACLSVRLASMTTLAKPPQQRRILDGPLIVIQTILIVNR